MSRIQIKAKLTIWFTGFLSALVFVFAFVLWMASSVYSELPKKSTINLNSSPFDVIVVLTGGKGRIKSAVDLYQKGIGKHLHISGIDKQINLKNLLKENEIKNDDINISYDSANNTIENAKEVKKFLDEHKLNKILLVTSIYHVRRSYFIFQKILPRTVSIEVSWSEREPFDENEWFRSWNGVWVTVSEYLKFIFAYIELAK